MDASLAEIDELLADPLLALNKKKKKKEPAKISKPASSELSGDQKGIIRTIVNNTGSALGYIGGSLDKIGSRQLRGLLGGKPRELISFIPFSDTLGITRPQDVVSGGDLLGTKGKKGFGYRLAEFGTELALDPLLIGKVRLGAKALSKGGQALSRAGMMDELGRSGRFADDVGPRVGRITKTVRDVVDSGDEALRASRASRVREAIAGLEKKPVSQITDDVLNSYLDQNIGGLAQVTNPFTRTEHVFGTGPRSQKIAGAMDSLQRKIGDSPVGLFAKRHFHAPSMDMATAKGQFDAQGVHAKVRTVRDNARGMAYSWAKKLENAGLDNDNAARMLRFAAENQERFADEVANIRSSHPDVADILDDANEWFEDSVARAQEIGVPQDVLQDNIKFFPRFVTATYDKMGKQRLFSGADPSQIGRELYLRGWMGPDYRGTESIKQIIADPGLGVIAKMTDKKRAQRILARQIEDTFGETLIGNPLEAMRPVADSTVAAVHQLLDHAAGNAGSFSDSNQFAQYLKAIVTYNPEQIARTHLGDNSPLFARRFSREIKQQLKKLGDFDGTDPADVVEMFKSIAASAAAKSTRQSAMSTRDISKRLARFMVTLDESSRSLGGFANHPVADFLRRQINQEEAIVRIQHIVNSLSDVGKHSPASDRTISVLDFLKQAGSITGGSGLKAGGGKLRIKLGSQESPGAYRYILEKLGVADSGALASMDGQQYRNAIEQLRNFHIDQDYAADLLRFLDVPRAHESMSKVIEGLDSFTSLFKMGVLTKPARFSRDFTSGIYQNYILGAVQSPQQAARAYQRMWNVIRGKQTNFADIPAVVERVAAHGLPVNAQTTTDAFKSMLAEAGLADTNNLTAQALTAGQSKAASSHRDLDSILNFAPGHKTNFGPREMATSWIPHSRQQANPLNVRGFGLGENKRMDSVFAPAKWGENMGAVVEAMNRGMPFAELMRQGYSPAEARLRVIAAHVDYDPTAFTTTEREFLARLFPFYRFTRKQIPFHFREIMEAPGGKLAQTLRGIEAMQGDEQPLPEHIAQTAAIPIGGAPEGFQRFVTGFGLPLEDAFGLIRPGSTTYKTVKGSAQEIAGRMHPLAKFFLETSSGVQMFSGRDMEDLRGTLSDLAYNMGITKSPASTPILLENFLSNMPTAGAASTLRQIVDRRKGVGAKLVNLFTGARVSDTDIAKSTNLAVRNYLEDVLRQDPNVHRFSHLYAPDSSQLSERNQELMTLYRDIAAMSAKEARARKKSEKAAKDELDTGKGKVKAKKDLLPGLGI